MGCCDECGADGVSLICICEPEKPHVPSKPRDVKAPRKRDSRPPETVSVPGLSAVEARSGHSPGKLEKPLGGLRDPYAQLLPQSTPKAPYVGGKVMCCRCRDVHSEADRLNEWGLKAGKVMAGRRTECPTGCGYHVTVPVDG